MDRLEAQRLDDYITGHYGEDQFRDVCDELPKPCPFCGAILEDRTDTPHNDYYHPLNECVIEGKAISADAPFEIYAWNTRPDIRRKTIEECAKLCEGQVQRPAGYNGAWEGYGPSMGDKTGTECAIAIRALAEAKP